MTLLRRIALCLSIFGASAHAANPVSWSMEPASGFPATAIGQQSRVSITLKSHLPGDGQSRISTHLQSSGGSFHISDGCDKKPIESNGECTVDIAFTPKDAGPHSIQMSYQYHRNTIALPPIAATVLHAPAGQAIQGSIFGVPPSFTLQPQQQPGFSVTYVNTSSSAVQGYAGALTVTSPARATVSMLRNSCGTQDAPVTLQAGKTCQISGQLTPVSAGAIHLQSTFIDQSHSKTSQVRAASVVRKGTNTCSLSVHTLLPLNNQVLVYSDNLVKYAFENSCNSAVKLGKVNVTVRNQAQAELNVSPEFDHCSGKTLGAHEQCTIMASAIPQASTNNMTVEARTLLNGVQTIAHSSTQVVAANNSQHNVRFINHCPFDVWYGIANGNGLDQGIMYSPDPTPGSQSAKGAPPSAYLVKGHQQGTAPFYKNLNISSYLNGAIWPRTNCRLSGGQFHCDTGYCATVSASSATCVKRGKAFSQPQPPYTKFEFTIAPTPGQDGVYDTSVINGMTVPVEIKGLGPSDATNPFLCSATGAPIQPAHHNLGSCSWSFAPPSQGVVSPQDFVWVSSGDDDNCTDNSDCHAGEVCGMGFDVDPPHNSKINRRCGGFLGYTTATNATGYSAAGQWGSQNLYEKFNVATAMTVINSARDYGNIGPNPATFSALLSCTPTSNNSANTCYNSFPGGKNTQCCGCVDWQNATGAEKTAVSKSCDNINSDWVSTAHVNLPVYDAILWLKKACPTAYSYQFDDQSSSFRCNKGAQGQNLMTSYDIIFCPGGQSSLPAGAQEAR